MDNVNVILRVILQNNSQVTKNISNKYLLIFISEMLDILYIFIKLYSKYY